MIHIRSASVSPMMGPLRPIALAVMLVGCSTSNPPKFSDRSIGPTEQQLPAGSTLLKGAGATFPSLLYKRWFSAYHDNHPNTYIRYEAVGSSEGIRRFLDRGVSVEESVDFGASDAALSDSQIAEAGNNVFMVPATAGCVVLAYNLPAFTGELYLSRKVYSGIFLGEITNWDDQQIAQSNPGVKLPHLTIATVVRQDGSGTTFAFTRNLDTINEKWRSQFGPVTLVNWPGNAMRATGNEGVASLIEKSTGAIGYVGYEFARRIGLNYASLENKAGKYIKPSEQSCAKAIATAEMPENLRIFVPDPDGADSYPIVTFSWILLRTSYRDAQTADAVIKLLHWSLTDGQSFAPELGYVALPAEVVKRALAALDKIGPHA
jgi:phosphate transport system substrate-binding protein